MLGLLFPDKLPHNTQTMELNVLEVYQQYIAPFIEKSQGVLKKNKAISIGAAVALAAALYINEAVIKPPRRTRHLPRVAYFDYMSKMLQKRSVRELAYGVSLPVLAKSTSGLYTVGFPTYAFAKNADLIYITLSQQYDNLGWSIHVASPSAAKIVLNRSGKARSI